MSTTDCSSNPILRRLGVVPNDAGHYIGGRAGDGTYSEDFIKLLADTFCSAIDSSFAGFATDAFAKAAVKKLKKKTSAADPCSECGDQSGRGTVRYRKEQNTASAVMRKSGRSR